jgi:predicted RNase H-like HicB family nuclease
MKVHAIIEKDEAGYYVAEVPAFPGCLSQGNTYDEAIANIKEAIQGWLETTGKNLLTLTGLWK